MQEDIIENRDHPWWNMYLSEREYAKKILATPPFSQERQVLIAEMYDSAWNYHKKFIAEGSLIGDQTTEKCFQFAKGVHNLFNRHPSTFLEIGCGNGSMCIAMAKLGWRTFGVDVNQEAINEAKQRSRIAGVVEKCEFYIDNISTFLPNQQFTCIFNKSVFAHMIPDEIDVIVSRWKSALKINGWLVFTFANRLNGPHDVSRPFLKRGDRAQGSHFFETTYHETIDVLRRAGFSRFRCPWIATRSWGPSFFQWTQVGLLKALLFENILACLPYWLRPIRGFGILVPMVIAAQ